MNRSKLVLAIMLLVSLVFAGVAGAHDELPEELRGALPSLPDGTVPHGEGDHADQHSTNMILVSNLDAGGTYRMGTDLAFWGDLAIAGQYGFPGGFYLIDISNPQKPGMISHFQCVGPQADVSIWKDLVFVSVDSPMNKPECEGAMTLGQSNSQVLSGQAYEGIRIVSIADRANPRQIAFVDTDCGSHTHTLVPDEANGRVLIYVLSYPLGGQSVDCNAETHRKFSVVEVPLNNPTAARVIATPSVAPAIGCHDVTVFLPGKLAGAACISESQIWDISDPVNPRVLSHIVNPAINIHHSSTFSYDGRTLAIGDELGGAAASPGCQDGADQHLPLGAIWFYDISNPATPQQAGTFRIPQEVEGLGCTAHNFNTVPMKTDRDVLVSAWYNGGTTVVDFTNPSEPRQIGFYIPANPRANAWSSYWYRGFIYANNFDTAIDTGNPNGVSRGFDVLAIADHDLKHNAIKLKRLNPQTMEPLR